MLISSGSQVVFAFTRTLDVRFDFVIRKSDIFRRSLGMEYHFFTQKYIFAAAQVNFFFVTQCAENKPIIIYGLNDISVDLMGPECKCVSVSVSVRPFAIGD